MISINISLLDKVCQLHTDSIKTVILDKIEVINLCLDYYSIFNKEDKRVFSDKLKNILPSKTIKVISVNWFLKAGTRAKPQKIKSPNKPDNFFKINNRLFSNKPEIIVSLKKTLNYFNEAKLTLLLSGKPSTLLLESQIFKQFNGFKKSKEAVNQTKRLIGFLFDYADFSEKKTNYINSWGGYQLTEKLETRCCLYCNRNYTLTVTSVNDKIIRPELDHFFAKSIHPVLALSFYNLIPSCHICNSNLKLKTEFNLKDYFHPYLSSFDDEKIKFTYEPMNPQAFQSDNRGLKIKLDTSQSLLHKARADKNIETFKLDYIYNEHQDIVESLLELQRKTNKNHLVDIYENILKDSNGKPLSNEAEIYEIAIRSYFHPNNYFKKPMAKFEKDIAEELGLINKQS